MEENINIDIKSAIQKHTNIDKHLDIGRTEKQGKYK